MKLPNSLTGPSNRSDTAAESKPLRAHGCLPGIIVLVWIACLLKPLLEDTKALALAPFAFFSFGVSLGVPPSLLIPVSAVMLTVLLLLPWLSLFASSIKTTVCCSFACLLLVLLQMSGCQALQNGFSKLAGNDLNQAQRACVMQPRVRRTLGIESPHTSTSPNPNGVPAGVRSSHASIWPALPKLALQILGIPRCVPQQRDNHPILVSAKINRIREGLGEDAAEILVKLSVVSR